MLGQPKRYCQAYTNFTLPKLRSIIDSALDSVSLNFDKKYYSKVMDYETAYQEGNKAGKEVENAVKKYVSQENFLGLLTPVFVSHHTIHYNPHILLF